MNTTCWIPGRLADAIALVRRATPQDAPRFGALSCTADGGGHLRAHLMAWANWILWPWFLLVLANKIRLAGIST